MSNDTQQTNNSILDVIHEKTANIEQVTNSQIINSTIQAALKLASKREKNLRASTLTFKTDNSFTHDELIKTIEEEWTDKRKHLSATYWQDKINSFVQFETEGVKLQFLNVIDDIPTRGLTQALLPMNNNGQHFIRRPTKLEINNVRANIDATRLKEILETSIAKSGGQISNFKEGKPNQITKSRGLYFRADQAAFNHIFTELDGTIPYVKNDKKIRTRLNIKINCKPWTCKDCCAIGYHECPGKLCTQCGQKGHTTKDCKSKLKYCVNCKRKGHRAKDIHCRNYLNEATKELQRMDIPIEFFEQKDLRLTLIKALQLK